MTLGEQGEWHWGEQGEWHWGGAREVALGRARGVVASFPGSSGGESRAWYTLFAHAREFMEEGQ